MSCTCNDNANALFHKNSLESRFWFQQKKNAHLSSLDKNISIFISYVLSVVMTLMINSLCQDCNFSVRRIWRWRCNFAEKPILLTIDFTFNKSLKYYKIVITFSGDLNEYLNNTSIKSILWEMKKMTGFTRFLILFQLF